MVPPARRCLLIALLTVTLMHLALIVAIAPVYETQDDPRMWSIVSGGVGGSGSDLMVFSNVLIGKCLVALYAKSPETPWYGSYLLLTHAVSHVAIFYGLMRRIGIRLGLFLLLGYFLTFGIYFHTHLQFTTTAFLACMGGLALLIEMIVDERAILWSPQVICAAALLAWGSMIRWDSFLCVGLLSLPLAGAVWHRRRDPGIARVMIGASLAVVLAVGTRWYDRTQYSTYAGWDDYLHVHLDHVSLADYTPSGLLTYRPDQADRILRNIGWSRNDFQCAKLWMWLDSNVYSPEKMARVHQDLSSASNRPVGWIIRALPVLWSAPGNSAVSFAILAAVSAFVYLIVTTSSRKTVLACWVLSSFLILGLAIFRKTPDRVVVPILILPLLITLLLSERFVFRVRPLHVIVAILLVLSGGRLVREGVMLSQAAAQIAPAIRSDYRQWVARGDRLKLLWFPNGTIYLPPLQEWPELRQGNEYWLDCLQRSPHADTVLQKAGVQNLLKEMLQREDIILISSPPLNKLLQTFLEEHGGIHVKDELVLRGTSFLRAYRLRSDVPLQAGVPD